MISTSAPRPSADPFGAVLGPRFTDEDDFAAYLRPASPLTPATIRSLFELTTGHGDIARAVVDGAQRAQANLDELDPEHFGSLLAPDALDVTAFDRDCPEVRLFLLLAQVGAIGSPVVSLAHAAIPRLGDIDIEALPGPEELTSRLVFSGLLRLGDPGEYAMPGLIRVLARRAGQAAPDGVLLPKQALRRELEDSHRALLEVGTITLNTLLALIADLDAWELLAEVWAERSFNIFYPSFCTPVQTILSAPASAVRDSFVLAEAQSAAREISHIAARTGSTDPHVVLPLITFDRIDAPTLDQAETQLDEGAFTADEVAVMTLKTLREHREQGDLSGAITAAEEGMRRIYDRQSATSRLYDVRLLMERGLDLARAGEGPRSQHLVERAVTIAETILPFDPYPLLPCLAIAAFGHTAAGHGPKADESLARYEELRTRFGVRSLQTDLLANFSRLGRALDQLDLETSAEAVETGRAAAGEQSSSIFHVGEALHRMYSGTAEFYLKAHGTVSEARSEARDAALSVVTMLSVATGDLRNAQSVAARAHRVDAQHGLDRARVGFALGQYKTVDSLTSHVLALGSGPREKATALSLRAAALKRRGLDGEALEDFRNALDYSVVAGTVQAFAQLPDDIREHFVDATAEAPQWGWIAETFGLNPVSGTQLRERLLALPVTLVEAQVESHVLDAHELDLLFRIEKQTPLSRIASDLSLAEGTVKNRLSAIYRKLGVRNRYDAVEYGYRNGYFS